MKKLLYLLAASIAGSAIAYAAAMAAQTSTVKVGILLPLTGTFAAVAETQRNGALLAVDVINKQRRAQHARRTSHGRRRGRGRRGEAGHRRAPLPLHGLRRRKGVGGQTWAPLAFAINSIVMKEPMPYFPVCVMAKEGFLKGKLATSTFATAYSPWTVGYMDGLAAVKTLGKKRIFFLARSDSFGWDMRDGLPAAKEHGAEIVGYEEVSLGTSDFTTTLQKVRAAKPDVFISAQFGADAVALLKQVHQMASARR